MLHWNSKLITVARWFGKPRISREFSSTWKRSRNFMKIAKFREISWNFGYMEVILQELLSTQFQFYFQRINFCHILYLIHFIAKHQSILDCIWHWKSFIYKTVSKLINVNWCICELHINSEIVGNYCELIPSLIVCLIVFNLIFFIEIDLYSGEIFIKTWLFEFKSKEKSSKNSDSKNNND